MTDPTDPSRDFDVKAAADRRGYSRTALARLVLAHECAELADLAAAHVATVSDSAGRPGEMVGEALQLVSMAQDVLTKAVVYERQKGTSWHQIGEQLGVKRQGAHERYREAEEDWKLALVEPLEPARPADINGRITPREVRLHHAAYNPTKTAHALDRWVREQVHHYRNTEHPVSGHLRPLSTIEEMGQILDAINLLHRTHAGPAERAEVMEWKADLLDRIAAEDGKPEAVQQAAEARAYAAQLRAEAEVTP